ncbi:MAG: hypothetical protein QGF59_13505, partial [Pirellulaceae bacterium]|nr:hypothetical protein [Pirellulaceae bacterium]
RPQLGVGEHRDGCDTQHRAGYASGRSNSWEPSGQVRALTNNKACIDGHVKKKSQQALRKLTATVE